MRSDNNGDANAEVVDKPVCFVVMPISDPEGYEDGHFRHVFDDLLVPACNKAGYRALRADEVLQTNLIHLDVLQKIVDSPMVLCDLSSRNPNVLFELGLRQAFDKPVALVQEVGTRQIFDITPLRFTNYRRELIYHEVLQDQEAIAAALIATKDAAANETSVNSIVKLLGLTHPAARSNIKASDRDSAMLSLIMTELSNLRSEIRVSRPPATERRQISDRGGILSLEFITVDLDNLMIRIDQLLNHEIPPTDFSDEIAELETSLGAMLSLKGALTKRERDRVMTLRQTLILWARKHDDFLRRAKAESEIK